MMVLRKLNKIYLVASLFFAFVSLQQIKAATPRAYVMLLVQRAFGKAPAKYYVLLKQEYRTDKKKPGAWNLFGGKQEKYHKTRGHTASEELYQESGGTLDFRGNHDLWDPTKGKSFFYEYGDHKVFVVVMNNIVVDHIRKAAQAWWNNPQMNHCYRETMDVELMSLKDLIDIVKNTANQGAAAHWYMHPKRSAPLYLEGWMLFTLRELYKKNQLPQQLLNYAH